MGGFNGVDVSRSHSDRHRSFGHPHHMRTFAGFPPSFWELLAGENSSAFSPIGLLPYQDGFDASLNIQKAGDHILRHARVVGDEGVFRSDSSYGRI